MPVPGGNDTENIKIFSTPDDMKARVEGLQAGMTEAQVFNQLGVQPDQLQVLSRPEIVTALYGSNALQIGGNPADQQALETYLQGLKGYSFTLENTKRAHGFVNPIRVRTDKKGYAYTVPLIFQNGALKESPQISGGPVNEGHSQTIFDVLTPASLFNRALP